MTEVDDHFGDPGFQVLHRLEIKISPFVCTNGGTSDDHRIQNDVLLREKREKLSGNAGKACRQKRQFVVMSDFDVDGEKLRCGERHTHVAVQMCGPNSESDGAFDLGEVPARLPPATDSRMDQAG